MASGPSAPQDHGTPTSIEASQLPTNTIWSSAVPPRPAALSRFHPESSASQATQLSYQEQDPAAEDATASLIGHGKRKSDLVRRDDIEPKAARKYNSIETIGFGLLDSCVALLALYFFIFGVLVLKYKGTSALSTPGSTLLRAAQLNPTLYPILFSAIVSKCLQSIAVRLLEGGEARIGTLEYLLGCRTVAGVLITPIRLRFFSTTLPLLVVLWSLSPLGGQASLRVVSSISTVSYSPLTVTYLNPLTPFIINSAVVANIWLSSINAAFNSALIAPSSVKLSSQDQFYNVKTPLLESILEHTHEADADGWWHLGDNGTQKFEYSSLTGLPLDLYYSGSLRAEDIVFTTESSYMYAGCSLQTSGNGSLGNWPQYPAPASDKYTTATFTPHIWAPLDSRSASALTKPRRIYFKSRTWSVTGSLTNVTLASCDLSTTYVETTFACAQRICNATKVRRSTLPHISRNLTVMDGLKASNNTAETWNSSHFSDATQQFFTYFINATSADRQLIGQATPLEYYFLEPNAPYTDIQPQKVAWLYSVGERVFSYRLSQLLNTYWMAGAAPNAVVGNFTTQRSVYTDYDVARTTGQVATSHSVIYCDRVWLTILLISSAVMFVAGIVSAIFGLQRKGPELLDTFAASLRDSPYVDVPAVSSTEDGSKRARRLKATKVMLGDVRPGDEHGHIAVATRSPRQIVNRIQPRRLYQ